MSRHSIRRSDYRRLRRYYRGRVPRSVRRRIIKTMRSYRRRHRV